LSIDLDHFKSVNDSLGHTAGDELLKVVAQRLRGCVRPQDLVARLGGDEFAILVAQTNPADDAAALAQRVIDALSQAIEVHGRHLRVGASVGVALQLGAQPDTPLSVDELLAHADTALYAAKEAGRSRFTMYTAQLSERASRRRALEDGLRHAVEAGQLDLHWQPKVDIQSWQIVGAEALLRWHHPQLGVVAPAEFIAVAEHTGLIEVLGRWALRESCRAAQGPLAGLAVSVNVSPAQLRSGQLVQQVREALREFALAPARLELEITESVLIDDIDAALAQMHALRELGVRIALDDFGTGYSSLAYLRRFPFDTLKLDRAFVSEVLHRDDVRAIVRMVSQLADTLGMCTVCEGVETVQQLAAVAQAGCDQVQGFLVSAPRELAAFVSLRQGWHNEPPLMATLH
jgi:diguanylate cyclase (GGDEF)-like protein